MYSRIGAVSVRRTVHRNGTRATGGSMLSASAVRAASASARSEAASSAAADATDHSHGASTTTPAAVQRPPVPGAFVQRIAYLRVPREEGRRSPYGLPSKHLISNRR